MVRRTLSRQPSLVFEERTPPWLRIVHVVRALCLVSALVGAVWFATTEPWQAEAEITATPKGEAHTEVTDCFTFVWEMGDSRTVSRCCNVQEEDHVVFCTLGKVQARSPYQKQRGELWRP
jgi:hypothetical protein